MGMEWGVGWVGIDKVDGREARSSRAPILVLEHARVVHAGSGAKIKPPSRVAEAQCPVRARGDKSSVFEVSQ